MNAPPFALFGGSIPDVAYLRHSMMVWDYGLAEGYTNFFERHTVFPEPLNPTIKVKGVLKRMVSSRVLSNERMLVQDYQGCSVSLSRSICLPLDCERLYFRCAEVSPLWSPSSFGWLYVDKCLAVGTYT